MSDFLVTTLADAAEGGADAFNGGDVAAEAADGSGLSLREALALANADPGEDGIAFDPALAGGVVRLVGGTLAVTRAATIDGDVDDDGAPDIVISGDTLGDDATTVAFFGATSFDVTDALPGGNLAYDDNVQVMSVEEGASARLVGLVITGGDAPLTGGGIEAARGSELFIADSLIAGNRAASGAERGSRVNYGGGGVSAEGDVEILRTTIAQNSALPNPELYYQAGNGGGGGLRAINDRTQLDRVTIERNYALSGGGAFVSSNDATIAQSTIRGNYGGGIYVSGNGSGVFQDPTTIQLYDPAFRIVDTLVEGNAWSRTGGGVSASGFGVILNSAIIGNEAVSGGGVTMNTDRIGRLDIIQSTIAGNHAEFRGGGVMAFQEVRLAFSIVTGNSATYDDGGLSIYQDDRVRPSQVINSVILGNSSAMGAAEATSFTNQPDNVAQPIAYASIIGPTFYDAVTADGVVQSEPIADSAAEAAALVFSAVGVDSDTDTPNAGLVQDIGANVPVVLIRAEGPAQDAGLADALIEVVTREPVPRILGSFIDRADDFNADGDFVDNFDEGFDIRGEGFVRLVGPALDLGPIELQGADGPDIIPPPPADPVRAGDVYRFFNLETGGHFFTFSEAERDAVLASDAPFRFENVGFEAADADDADRDGTGGLQPVFRFFNLETGGHFFTISEAERDAVLASDAPFRFEGVGFAAYETADAAPGALPVFRFFNLETGGHFFTVSEAERDAVLASDAPFRFEDVGFYAYADFDGLLVTTAADGPDGTLDAYNGGAVSEEAADGEGLSLREALALANADPDVSRVGFDPIVFQDSVTPFEDRSVITLSGGELVISTAVILDGDANRNGLNDDIALSGDADESRAPSPSDTRVLRVSDGGALTLRALNVTQGYAPDAPEGEFMRSSNGGGGLYVQSNTAAVVESVIFTDNRAQVGGGALVNGSATFTNVTFQDNQAFAAAAIDVYSQGSLRITDSVIAGNEAESNAAAIRLFGGGYINRTLMENNVGAGLGVIVNYAFDDARTTILNSAIITNRSESSAATVLNFGDLYVVNSTIYGNESSGLEFPSGQSRLAFGEKVVTLSFAERNARAAARRSERSCARRWSRGLG